MAGGDGEKAYLTPSALAALPTSNEKGFVRDEKLNTIESPTAPQKHQNVDEKSDIVSQLDSTAVDSGPPSYAEVEYQGLR